PLRSLPTRRSSDLSPSLPPAPIRSRESSWEVSGVNLNSNWRARLYIRNLELWKEWRRSIAATRVFQRHRKRLEAPEGPYSSQTPQRDQLALIAKFDFEGTKHPFACQKRAQVVGRQTDASSFPARDQDSIGAP